MYRENRLDDQLSTAGNYLELRGHIKTLADRVAKLVKRYVRDVQYVTDKTPQLIMTADHGFTYGPSPGAQTRGHVALNGSHRCIELDRPVHELDLRDESITVVDPDRFHVKQSYLAARGRYFGSNTVSGWKMTHGGLLPEEVIIPVVEWYGSETAITWPRIEYLDTASRIRGEWQFQVKLRNDYSLPSASGSIVFRIAGSLSHADFTFLSMPPGEMTKIDVLIPDDIERSSILNVEVCMTTMLDNGVQRAKTHLLDIPISLQLSERTEDQDAFEEMF